MLEYMEGGKHRKHLYGNITSMAMVQQQYYYSSYYNFLLIITNAIPNLYIFITISLCHIMYFHTKTIIIIALWLLYIEAPCNYAILQYNCSPLPCFNSFKTKVSKYWKTSFLHDLAIASRGCVLAWLVWHIKCFKTNHI